MWQFPVQTCLFLVGFNLWTFMIPNRCQYHMSILWWHSYCVQRKWTWVTYISNILSNKLILFNILDFWSTRNNFSPHYPPKDGIIHGLVDPLFGTSWHKWNRYKLHRGIDLVPCHKEWPPSWVYDLCHGTRRGLFWPVLDPMEQVWFNQVVVPVGQVQPVPICLSHWDRLYLFPRHKHNLCQSACAIGTKSNDQFWGHPLSKTKEVLIEFQKFLIKNRSKIET